MPVVGCLKQNMIFRRQRKRGKVVVGGTGPGPIEFIAGYETNNCGEFQVRYFKRWRGLVGRWEVGHGRVSRGMLQTEHGLPKREKERESGGWTRTKRLQIWI